MHWNFLNIYMYLIKLENLNDMILINFIFESPFHIKSFASIFFYQSHVRDIHKLVY
jgi:hypothetical protein